MQNIIQDSGVCNKCKFFQKPKTKINNYYYHSICIGKFWFLVFEKMYISFRSRIKKSPV